MINKKALILIAMLASSCAFGQQQQEQYVAPYTQGQPQQDQYVPPYMQGQPQQSQQQSYQGNNYCQGRGCGVITNIVQRNQTANGNNIIGTIAGGVLGGLLGNRVGRGTGNTLATVAGAAGGAVAGNVIQQRMDSNGQQNVNLWDVQVRFDDGHAETFTFNNTPQFQHNQRVNVINGKITSVL